MTLRAFVKTNAVLVVGLALPLLLMAGFMLASGLPQRLSEPPTFSLVFAVSDYSPTTHNLPVSVRLVVQDGVLKAQYVSAMSPAAGYVNNSWKKLYLYDAPSQNVRELPFGFPADMNAIQGSAEEVVEATRTMRLDTTLKAPDGYELSYSRGSGSLYIGDFLWSAGSTNEARLRKGSASVTLGSDSRSFPYGSAEFVGWVVGSR